MPVPSSRRLEGTESMSLRNLRQSLDALDAHEREVDAANASRIQVTDGESTAHDVPGRKAHVVERDFEKRGVTWKCRTGVRRWRRTRQELRCDRAVEALIGIEPPRDDCAEPQDVTNVDTRPRVRRLSRLRNGKSRSITPRFLGFENRRAAQIGDEVELESLVVSLLSYPALTWIP